MAKIPADIDIWRTANLMIKQHGDEASIFTAMKADEMLEKGDMVGQRVWQRVLRAVEELLRDRGEAERLN